MRKLLSRILGTKKHSYKIINIYVDKDDTLTFIPTGESKKWHLTTDLNDLSIELAPPYSDTDLEDKIFEAMKFCFLYEPEDVSYNSNIEKVKASKAYNKQVNGKRLISMRWIKTEGYIITPFKKAKDRGFEAINENNIMVGTSPTTGVLAKAIKDAMRISKPY